MEILSITIPIFLFVAGGYYLRKKGIIGEEIKNFLSKFVYYFAFPAMIFESIVKFDFASTFRIKLVAFNLTATVVIFVISFIMAFFIKNKKSRGAFHMSCFRSNQGYMGMPVANGFYGQEAMSKAAIVNGFDMPLVIILSVFSLEIFRKGKKDNSKSAYTVALEKFKNFITNPFIITSVLGLVFSYYKIPVLKIGVLKVFLSQASSLALPLSLLSIGCSIEVSHLKNNFKLVTVSSAIKLIILPAIALFLGYYLFNLRGTELGLGVILSAMPTSVSSYIMAAEMDTDAELSATIIGFTTFVSVVTISIIQFILKQYII